MGGAQPLAVTLNGGVALCVEVDREAIERRLRDALPRRARRRPRRRRGARCAAGERRSAARSASASTATRPTSLPALLAPRLPGRHRHRPDERPRPAQRLRAEHDDRSSEADELRDERPDRSTSSASRRAMAAHCAAMVGFKDAGAEVFDYGNSLRAEAKLGGFERAFDYPGLRARLRPPAVLRGQGAVPLGRAVGRPRRHRRHRPRRARGVPRRRAAAPLDRRGGGAGRLPGPAGPDLLARLRRAPPARAALQRDGRRAASCRRRS